MNNKPYLEIALSVEDEHTEVIASASTLPEGKLIPSQTGYRILKIARLNTAPP